MRRFVLLCAFLFLAGTSPLAAQPQFRVSPSVGGAVPLGPDAFEAFYSTSPQFGLGVEYVLTSNLSIHLRGHYTRLQLTRDGVIDFVDSRTTNEFTNFSVSGPTGSVLGGTATLSLRTPLPRRFLFHGILGFGVYRQSLYDVRIEDETGSVLFSELQKTSPGITIGFRLAYRLSHRLRPFVTPHYALIFSEGQQLSDQPFGQAFVGSIRYIPIRIGVSIDV
jgi:hypothetical protein